IPLPPPPQHARAHARIFPVDAFLPFVGARARPQMGTEAAPEGAPTRWGQYAKKPGQRRSAASGRARLVPFVLFWIGMFVISVLAIANWDVNRHGLRREIPGGHNADTFNGSEENAAHDGGNGRRAGAACFWQRAKTDPSPAGVSGTTLTSQSQDAAGKKTGRDGIPGVLLLSYALNPTVERREQSAPHGKVTSENWCAQLRGGHGSDYAFALKKKDKKEQFFAPLTECHIAPPIAPMQNAPPMSLTMTHGLARLTAHARAKKENAGLSFRAKKAGRACDDVENRKSAITRGTLWKGADGNNLTLRAMLDARLVSIPRESRVVEALTAPGRERNRRDRGM
ncbi:MAG: hypothetical protein BJ554DRAFT_7251, partial [Olpidium bornovanus]